MFHLKTRDEYRKKMYWIRLSFQFFTLLFFVVFILNTIYVFNLVNISQSFFKIFLQSSLYAMSSITIINLIIYQVIYIKYKKKLIWEYLEILSKAKVPSKLPKVVYVYTTHNDFIPARMLQNMQQTYKNMEYWISDGSSNLEISKEIKEFAKKHKINLFKMNKPSENKADNLNTFLNETKVKFDYLLIGDADVAFDKKLVECNLRYFYTENQIRLGYVSSMIQDYKTKNFFSNMLRFVENLTLFKKDINKVLRTNYSPNLYSACCLLKKEYLDDMNNFPPGCFEDGYLELNGSKKYWYGLISPLTLSLQKFDENIKKYKTRQLRIIDWIIKYEQSEAFVNINNKFKSTYNEYFINLFSGPAILLSLILLPLFILFLVWFWPIFITTLYYWIILGMWLISGWIISAIANYDSAKIMGKANAFFFPLFQFLLFMSYWPSLVKHWFKAFVLKKYSTFMPSRARNYKNKKQSKFQPIKFDLLIMLISLTILGLSLFLFLYFKWYMQNGSFNWYLLFLFIALSSISGMFFISYFSTIILYLLSFIENNKDYDDEKFVEYNNDYVKFTNLKDKFFKNNLDIERFC